ncbi:centromere protein J [Nilaparvata lugens]|uniref:centromere protein J n=1 Tax=Nilaparvata lugens TaxID=108931 RepID=UPI00193CCD32|nr:centromere protein J [Nilaparvata lugens]
MECDLERLTIKQKIKELMKWQETQEKSFHNQSSESSSADNDKFHIDSKLEDDQSSGRIMESYDKFLPSNIEVVNDKFSNNDVAITIKAKKPFLRKGAGLARYKMTHNTVSSNRPKSRQTNAAKSDYSNNKPVTKSKTCNQTIPDDLGTNSRKMKVTKSNFCTSDEIESKSSGMQVAVPNKLEDVTKWADVLQKQSEMSSREADELRIFEMLEEKAAESSFCSSSSIVAKFMELTVRSTPKKNKNNKVGITCSETLKVVDLACPVNGECYSSSDGESDFASSDCDSEKSSCSLTSEGRMILSLIDKYREFALLDGDLGSNSFSNISDNNVNDFFHRTNRAETPVKIREIKENETCDREVEPNNDASQSLDDIDEEVNETLLDPSKNEDLKATSSITPAVDKCSSTNMTTNDNLNKNGNTNPTKMTHRPNENSNDTDSVMDGSVPYGVGLINGACNLQSYMKKIQEELKNLENETERVRQVRGRYEEEYRKFKREKETFLRTHENERRLFEIEIEEEKKKLQKERTVFERHSKPLRSKPALALENEIKMLQEKVLKLQDELKEKQKNWAISQSSVRSQLHSLVEANKTLRQEMIEMKDREKKLLEKEKKNRIHSYRQKSQFKNVNDHLEAVNESDFEPPAVVECISSNTAPKTNVRVMKNVEKSCDKNDNVNEDHLFPPEKPLKILHPNGDIQITYDDGTNHYYFKESHVWHKKYCDGLELVVFDDGQIEINFEDGTREVLYTNGCRKLFVTGGDELWCYKNGDHVIVKKSGDRVLAFASGEVEIHRKDYKLKQYPDSSCKYLFANGVTETRYADGRVRVKDKEGNLLKDNKQDLTQQCMKLLDKVMTNSS